MQDTLQKSIEISKQNYFKLFKKLAISKINPKCYWSILISFRNNKKISLIHNNQFVVDFKEKIELLAHPLQGNAFIESGRNLPTQILHRTNKQINP